MGNISEIFNEFKTEVEKQQFINKQHETIASLLVKNKQLENEITHLKTLLLNSPLIKEENSVERIIITPEEALIERQIEMLQNRSFNTEMTLEDTKKLDLLLKNKHIIKDQFENIKADSKKVDKRSLTKAELILIASSKKPEDG